MHGRTRVAVTATLIAALSTVGGSAAFADTSGPQQPLPVTGSCSPSTPSATTAAGSPTSTVIVVARGGAQTAPAAVQCASGQVEMAFSAINGVLATVPTSQLPSLESNRNLAVTPDLPVSLQSTPVSTGPHTPSDAFRQETGQSRVLASGDSGAGVNVAVLDTGIAALPDFAGRLVGGVDLTGGGKPFSDGYGHGTFVAGLIAGNGVSSGGEYSGEAPGAGLVSIKVAGANGQTDLATVIAGVEWAIAHRQADHIRVLNLSLGFRPVVSALLDPLDRAVEAAWNDGIVVVTSAGNAGPFNGTILSPGDDPLAITVGALDDMATPSPRDDEMTNFSSVGPTNPDGFMKPDLVTSGRSVVSLADPGSTVYQQNPSALVGTSNFVGSGTSFSAAITSGAVALLLSHDPGLTPDQVKARLLGNATRGPVGNPLVDGHGALDIAAAIASGPLDLHQSTAGLRPVPMGATVSLAPTGPANTWNPELWSGTAWNGTAWNGTAWNGTAWNGTAWNGTAWNGTAWNGTAWN
ncbi:MAG TPA: S8 family peptidase [Acidimicrobiales bacterium]|nr:S8 family peptidase [Acidimicrobiales bacterium]